MKPKRSLMILIVMLLVSASAFAGYNIYRFPAMFRQVGLSCAYTVHICS